MAEKRKGKDAGPSDSLHSSTKRVDGFIEILCATIGKLLTFDVSPERLDRIQVWRVAGESLDSEPTALTRQVVCHGSALVRGKVVPNENRFLSPHVLLEILQEDDECVGVIVPLECVEEESAALSIPSITNDRGNRGLGPVEGVDQERRFASPGPRSADRGALLDSAFVLEEDPRLLAASVFFTSGHFCDIHSLIASPSRSLARRAGRCSVQSIAPRIFHIWPG